ncbi:cysteine hydrolase family protein [Paenibacillus glycanilyticus]|uniref:Peroxyureidoacrylate/ureidoacrylate amidohydrolase RutB n=1 Tax=Paenibacillus glycanilyticus TaxID=126569 RepID=A0ABQ6GHZ2_9BACL|nr:isochorismatase family cysteine hydrolase [Paenibacillus glycanilyticus]GLX70569.1 peroxyureidoacrylate/ureidoacrylate amidohydrolase RutB [Paenibacillus glycanilyticus]
MDQNQDKLKKRLEHKNTAIIVVDVQNDYCHPEGAIAKLGTDVSSVKNMMPNLHALLEAAQQHHVPVIYLQTNHEKATDSEVWVSRFADGINPICHTGSWGAEFYEVSPLPDDIIVKKHRYSGFIHTRLESVLQTLKIETLIMTGVSTNLCVESTARDGFMMDYHIVLMKDACAAFTQEEHDMTVQTVDTYFGMASDTKAVISFWQQQPNQAPQLQH